MKYCKQFVLLLMLCVSLNGTCFAADSGAPSPNIPELKQLDLFSGEWEAAIGNLTEKILSKRSWMLNGYFLKHTFEASNGALRGVIYRGYDKERQHYTLLFMDSQGNASMLTGNWNADLKTFVFEAVDASSYAQQYESYFPNDKTEQWTITVDSEQRNQISGVAHKISN